MQLTCAHCSAPLARKRSPGRILCEDCEDIWQVNFNNHLRFWLQKNAAWLST
jgi:uncharacterized Zn finger protein (UPF0148 family)